MLTSFTSRIKCPREGDAIGVKNPAVWNSPGIQRRGCSRLDDSHVRGNLLRLVVNQQISQLARKSLSQIVISQSKFCDLKTEISIFNGLEI